tara:strand:- start:9281 stop:10582 length:1302 start_codon:yes stop_codon:yes gene_type:complete
MSQQKKINSLTNLSNLANLAISILNESDAFFSLPQVNNFCENLVKSHNIGNRHTKQQHHHSLTTHIQVIRFLFDHRILDPKLLQTQSKPSLPSLTIVVEKCKTPIITINYPLQCIIKRKACYRVIGTALYEMDIIQKLINKTSNPLDKQTVFAHLHLERVPQVNVLIALAAMGLYVKPKAMTDASFFDILQEFPRPYFNDEANNLDAEVFQFRTLYRNREYIRSDFDITQRQFVWRLMTSYRYREHAFMKQNNLLNMIPLSKHTLNKLKNIMLNQPQKKIPIYIEYKFYDYTCAFLGSINDVLGKVRVLNKQSNGYKQLMNSKINDYPIKKEHLVANILKDIKNNNSQISFDNSDLKIISILINSLPELLIKLWLSIPNSINNIRIDQFATNLKSDYLNLELKLKKVILTTKNQKVLLSLIMNKFAYVLKIMS